jgi:hypothetical protein
MRCPAIRIAVKGSPGEERLVSKKKKKKKQKKQKMRKKNSENVDDDESRRRRWIEWLKDEGGAVKNVSSSNLMRVEPAVST